MKTYYVWIDQNEVIYVISDKDMRLQKIAVEVDDISEVEQKIKERGN